MHQTYANDWDPGTYGRFRDLRLRPALDLIARVPALPPGTVVDLGCGAGAAGHALSRRWPDRRLIGLDTSRAMLAVAGTTGAYAALHRADAALWRPETPPALIFSNAVLHWLPDHEALLPRLAGILCAGGTMALQMPDQQHAASHRLLGDLAATLDPGRDDWTPRNVRTPPDYHRILAPLGDVAIWRTEYLQRLAPTASGHPVRHFTQATAMRPHLDALPTDLHKRYVDACDTALFDAYPPEPDGSVLFPFRRLFAVLTKAP